MLVLSPGLWPVGPQRMSQGRGGLGEALVQGGGTGCMLGRGSWCVPAGVRGHAPSP